MVAMAELVGLILLGVKQVYNILAAPGPKIAKEARIDIKAQIIGKPTTKLAPLTME